jgi:hypothetical protein
MNRKKLCALMMAALGAVAMARAEFQINTYTEHHQTHPVVAMNAQGDFVVVWRSHVADGRDGGVFARCFDSDGTPTCDEFQVNSTTAGVDNWFPAVGIGPSGDVVVVWVAEQADGCDLVAKLYDRQGLALTDEFRVSPHEPDVSQSMPSVAVGPDGSFAVVWINCYEFHCVGRRHAAGRLYYADGTPRTEEFAISDVPQANWPDVDMDDEGRFVVTWIQMGDTYNRPYGEYIMFRQFEADGAPIGDAVQITDDLNSRWYGPSIAVNGDGAFVIAWAIGPFPYDVVVQHFGAGGMAATEPYLVNTFMEGNQGHPQIAGNKAGRYLVVWDSQGLDGNCYGVAAQQCGAGAALIGDEVPVSTFQPGRQWYPDVAMAADSTYVVVWISEHQDGSGYGVFGEIGVQ